MHTRWWGKTWKHFPQTQFHLLPHVTICPSGITLRSMRHSGARLPSRRVRAATAASTAVNGAGRGDPVISSASCTTRRCPATASKFQLEKVRVSNRSLSTVIVIVWETASFPSCHVSGLPPCVPAKPPAPHPPWLGLSGMAARSAAADWSPCHVASETNDAPGWADDQGNVAMSGPNSKLSSEVVQDWGQSLEIYNSAPTSLHLNYFFLTLKRAKRCQNVEGFKVGSTQSPLGWVDHQKHHRKHWRRSGGPPEPAEKFTSGPNSQVSTDEVQNEDHGH